MATVNPLRVLVIRNAFEHDFGGAETYVLNLSLALRAAGHEPVIVTRVTRLITKAQDNKLPVIRGLWHAKQGWGRNYRLWGPLVTLWYVWVILSQRIHIVHPQSRDDFMFATAAAKLLGRRVVWTDHGDLKYILVPSAPQTLRSPLIKAAGYTTAVIAVSKSEQTEILAVAPEVKNLRVIYNGIFPPGDVTPAERTAKLIIGATSRLVVAKGIGELITAFSKIKQINEAELWLVGDGPDKEQFIQLAKSLGVTDRVKFLGYQTDVWPLLAALDIFVHPSYHEAFCLSIVEATMAGRPIIATRTGGNPEIVTPDVGLLVPIKDALALTRAIDELASDPGKRKKLGDEASRIAHADYDFQRIITEQVLPLYNKST
jgi:glycosyltransferase involved in cell wall biosynthesis